MVLTLGRQLALVVGCQGVRVLGSIMETTLVFWGIITALLGAIGLTFTLTTPAWVLVALAMGPVQGVTTHKHNIAPLFTSATWFPIS